MLQFVISSGGSVIHNCLKKVFEHFYYKKACKINHFLL